MKTIAVTLSLMVVCASAAVAQKSEEAEKRASSWFNNVRDTFLKRSTGLRAEDITIWTNASKKAKVEATSTNLFWALPTFNPLWDKDDKLLASASTKYAKRLEKIPHSALKNWATLTGLDPLCASLSLTPEDDLFPEEKFSHKAFATFAAKFK